MLLLQSIVEGLRTLFRKEQVEQEMDKELSGHPDAVVKEKMRSAMSQEQAQRAARVEMGSMDAVKEEGRSVGWEATLETFWKGLRYGVRQLRRSPGFTAVVVIILALGIGASAAIFSILYATAIRPLPYQDPDQLVALWRTDRRLPAWPTSGPDFLDWEKQSNVFSALAAAWSYGPTLTDAGGNEPLHGYHVTPDFFKALKVQPAKGRLFAAGDDQAGRDHVVVLGSGFQARRPGRALAAVGQTLRLDGEEFAVIGSVPGSFRFPPIFFVTGAEPDVYVPMPVERLRKDRQEASFWVIGRLKPGITIRQAQAQMTTIASRLAQQYPDSNAGIGVSVVTLQAQVRSVFGILFSFLLCAVGFLLLLACANVAVLLFGRGARRQHEIAIRQAVGASRARIVMQLLTESILLALAGGAVGVLLAFWFKDAMVSLFPSHLIPQTNPITINWQVLVFALVVSGATGILFGLLPALQLSRVNLQEWLQEGAHAADTGVRTLRLRNVLVASEVALALCLLIVCGLMIRALAGILLAKPGFNARNMLTTGLTFADSKYPTFGARDALRRELIEQVNALPGVKSSALEGSSAGHLATTNKSLTPSSFREGPFLQISMVTPDYFRTMQLPLLRGRPFSSADYLEKPSVAIINSTLARNLWPNQDALGKRITTTYPPEWYEVVGIAADRRIFGGAIDIPEAYLPKFSNRVDLLVRTVGDPKGLMTPIRNLIRRLDKDARVSSMMTMEENLAQTAGPIRYIAVILSAMAIIALLLATIGVYAVTAYSVAQRTHEIGVRMALGAQRSQVLFFVMRRGMLLSFLGILIGLLIGLGVGRVLAFFLRGVTIGQISTYLGVSMLLLVVTLVASYIPARHATKIDPIAALRCE